LAKIGFPFYELSTVDSTNNYAMARVHEGMALHGMAVFAHDQTAGKGQRGKTWVTEPGANIVLSIVADTLPIRHLPPFALSAAAALAAYALFTDHAVHETSIKWPNDIYWRDRKAGGILIENIYRGHEWQWAVIGIGINVNQTTFPEGIRPPVSLHQITGRAFDAVQLAGDLCNYLEAEWQSLITEGPIQLFERYQRHLFQVDQLVRLKKDNIVFETRVKGVDTQGRLMTGENGEILFSVGQVEWVL
jgi:BirA family biotin operon repressor/biotin-[acetyl-CoA-carboxylase] ligase